MKVLSSFAVLSIEGGERVSFTYNELNEEGDIISTNNKKSFFAVDPSVVASIKAVKEYIETHKM